MKLILKLQELKLLKDYKMCPRVRQHLLLPLLLLSLPILRKNVLQLQQANTIQLGIRQVAKPGTAVTEQRGVQKDRFDTIPWEEMECSAMKGTGTGSVAMVQLVVRGASLDLILM